MPYITQADRKFYEQEINNLVNKLVDVFSNEPTKITRNRAGHVNYIISKTIYSFYTKLQKKLMGKELLNYCDYNEIIGVLECIKTEFYRKVVSPYENVKEDENGEVFKNE